MSEAHFSIPRYWGSDDSDIEKDDKSADKLEKVLKKARKRKRKMEKLNGSHLSTEVPEIEDALVSNEVSDTQQLSSKKRKINKREINVDEFESNQNISVENNDTIPDVPIKKTKKKHKNKKKLIVKQNVPEGYTIIGEDGIAKAGNVQRVLPNWLANPTRIDVDLSDKKSAVSDLDYLDSNTKNNLLRIGVNYLFPVQTAVIPYLMKTGGKRRLWIRPSDICVSAPTGSGKTLAYVLPIVQCLRERLVPRVRAVVVLPVGDLAFQVFKVFNAFCKGTDLHVALITGNKSFAQEQNSLLKKFPRYYLSLVDIIVATPGRLLDHINYTPGFSLDTLRYLVIDEADRLMEEIQRGWLKKVENAVFKNAVSSGCCCFSAENLFKRVSKPPTTACEYNHISEPFMKLLYSATLSQNPEKLHELSLYDPILFATVTMPKDVQQNSTKQNFSESNFIGKYTTPDSLKEFHLVCDPSVKPLVIFQLIHDKGFKRVLCFTKSVENSHRLYLLLNEMGDFKVREISSSLKGIQRKIILSQFAAGKVNVLVCSDLMARGMDIENVDCVISYDAPDFIRNYIHRIGRTARAGREGCTVTLLDVHEEYRFMKMLKKAGKAPTPHMDFDFQKLKTGEKCYKAALNVVSNTIADEKRKNYLLKGSFKNRKKTVKTSNIQSNEKKFGI